MSSPRALRELKEASREGSQGASVKGGILKERFSLPESPWGVPSPEEDSWGSGNTEKSLGPAAHILDGNFEEMFDVRVGSDDLESAAVTMEGLPFWPYEKLQSSRQHPSDPQDELCCEREWVIIRGEQLAFQIGKDSMLVHTFR